MRLFPTALVLLLAGCGGSEPSSPNSGAPGAPGRSEAAAPADRADWPPGTVLAIDSMPVSVDEVDLASVWIERIQPQAAGRQLRRLALTNVVLPRTVAALAEPRARERARREAEARLAELASGGVPGPPNADGGIGIVAEGTWQVLGIPLWGQALDWPEDEWHLIEEPGRFVVARRLARIDQPHPTALVVRIDSFLFPYLDDEFDYEGAKDHHRMTIVDPEWREIVPELTQYQMGVHGS